MREQLSDQVLLFESDHLWISRNLDVLWQQHADQWIAVKAGKVVATAPELANLLSQLSDPAHTCIEFITREPLEMVL
jgi:hypothetical protein